MKFFSQIVSTLLVISSLHLSFSSAAESSSSSSSHLRKIFQSSSNKGQLNAGNINGPVDIAPITNPYGMVVVPSDSGNWKANDLLISGWNDINNNFGQGNNITVVRNGVVQPGLSITIDPKDTKHNIPYNECKADGIGFTMAMTYLDKGKILQCSTPIPLANNMNAPAKPGCCFIINDQGRVLATYRNNLINGPWGASSTKSGNDIYIWISNVLGSTGYVARYKISNMPDKEGDWKSGDADNNNWGTLGKGEIIAQGFVSTPANGGIQGGAVGPAGLAYTSHQDRLYISGTLDGQFGALFFINNPRGCTGNSCNKQQLVMCKGGNAANDCNAPIGLNLIKGSIVVANGQDMNLVEYDTKGTKLSFRTINQSLNGNHDNGAGFLFNVIGVNNQIAFVDDALNSVSFIGTTTTNKKK